MKKALLLTGLVLLATIVGCAWVSKEAGLVAPSQVDATGNVIPGTHALTPAAQDATKQIPYGDVIVGIGLLIWNGIERYKASKMKTALTSTVQTIENAGDDPAMAANIATLKTQLDQAHQVAGIQPIVQDILAKI